MKVVVLTLALLLACTLTMSQRKRSRLDVKNNKVVGHAKVTLDIFSGRKNPTWSLNREQTESLLLIVKGLSVSGPSDFFDGLGYRGFQVTMTGPVYGKKSAINVYRGKVRYEDGDNIRYLTDKDRQIEQLLLKYGSPHLPPGLYKTVGREVRPPAE
jgi:hypothetical protein